MTKTENLFSSKHAERNGKERAKAADAPLRECVREALEEFFLHLDGHPCQGLYDMVLNEVEGPLLDVVMNQTGGNQSSAAEILGISRGTLRKKLRAHALL